MEKIMLVSTKAFVCLVVQFLLFSITAARAQSADSSANGGTEQDGAYTPGSGFKLVSTDQGEVRFRVYSYVRYLNQLGLDATYTDAFGNTTSIDRRQDVQLNKVNIQFIGWLMDPKLRYAFYVWTNNTAQGQGAQVVVAGKLDYRFGDHLTLGGGVDALPGVRTTEGNFPYWLTVDNRAMADEFFRGSYTMGFWARGEIIDGLLYQAMVGNNLSQLGVDAGQLDDGFNTVSAALAWYPTTGEYGKRAQFGDFDDHEQVATRIAAHFTRSPENRQGQPSTDAFENVQIRLSDGSAIFTPDLFGAGVQIDDATYHMTSVDAGVKYRGFALEGGYYWRWVNGFRGPGTATLPFDELTDNGFQLLASSMLRPRTVQLYAVWSKIFGEYGDPWEVRGGVNLYPWKNQVVRCNLEYIYTKKSPVGGLSLPYQVGGTGDIFHFNFQVDF
jgi:hypothetical protein